MSQRVLLRWCICYSQAFRRTILKNLLINISIFNYSCSSTAATKWNTVAIKVILLFEAGLFITLDLMRKGQRKWNLNRKAFTAGYEKSFLPHLLVCRSYMQGNPEQLLQFLSCFSFVVKLGVSLSISCHGRRYFNGLAFNIQGRVVRSWVKITQG